VNLTSKQKLMLFYIHCKFSNNEYHLIKTFDRWDFPSELASNLEPLIENQFIITLKNNTGLNYFYSTKKGEEYISQKCFLDNIINYVESLEKSTFLMSITCKLIETHNEQN
jgi:hypothetical protein